MIDWNVDLLKKHCKKVGLPSKMIDTIMGCIISASFRLLWNEEETKRVISTQDLHYGDLVSPYIFVLFLECPHTGFRRRWQQDGNPYEPLEVGL